MGQVARVGTTGALARVAMCRSQTSSRSLFLALFTAALVACSSSSEAGTPATQPAADPTPIEHEGESKESKEKEKDATTELVVGIDAEDFQSQGFTINELDVIAKVDGLVAANEALFPASAPLFPHELRLRPPIDKPEATVEIEVIARDRPEATMPPIVTRHAKTHFVKGKTKLAYVFLEVRCNTFPLLGGGGPSGPTCAAPTTCVAGRCVPSDLPALTDYRADWAKSPPSACGTGTAELTIGGGEVNLEPLADGATVTLEQGGQCGHHVWLSLRMKNLAQSGTITTVSATQPGTSIGAPATAYPFAWGPSDGGACDLLGLRFQLDTGGAKASDFVGKPLDIKVEAKDKAGVTATSTKRVNIATEIKVIPGRGCGSGPSG
jgi:hypothetical protein